MNRQLFNQFALFLSLASGWMVYGRRQQKSDGNNAAPTQTVELSLALRERAPVAPRLNWVPVSTSLFRHLAAGQEQHRVAIWRRVLAAFDSHRGHVAQRTGRSGSRQSDLFPVGCHYDGRRDVHQQRRRRRLLRRKGTSVRFAFIPAAQSGPGVAAHFAATAHDDGQLRNVARPQPLSHFQRHEHSAEPGRTEYQSVRRPGRRDGIRRHHSHSFRDQADVADQRAIYREYSLHRRSGSCRRRTGHFGSRPATSTFQAVRFARETLSQQSVGIWPSASSSQAVDNSG